VSLADQQVTLDRTGRPEPLPVRLRFADARVRVAFLCPTAADGLLPALAHALDAPLGPFDATITVRRQVDDVAALAWWERATPLRLPLTRVLGADGRRVVHASVVGDERGGLALVGPPGSGKTTTALAAVRGGLGFVADDYVLLRAGTPFEAVCLYSTACFRAGSDDATKQVVDVASLRADALRRTLPLRGVAVTRMSGGETRWSRVGAAVALRAWAPATALVMAGERGAALPLLAAIVRSVPCYSLDVGHDASEVAAAVSEMLDRSGSRS
jgi:hypothetical protein